MLHVAFAGKIRCVLCISALTATGRQTFVSLRYRRLQYGTVQFDSSEFCMLCSLF